MLVAAIDPGGTTGLAFRYANGAVQAWTERDRETVYRWVLAVGASGAHIVFETFNSQIRTSSHGLTTIEFVGGIEALCLVNNIPYTRQAPNKRLPFIEKAKAELRSQGNKFVEHQVDALAHLLAWERFNCV